MKISISGYPGLGPTIVGLFNIRTAAHVYHLRTRSLAQHEALNSFYDAIVPLADRFAEAAIGATGVVEDWPQRLDFDLTMEPLAFFHLVRDSVKSALDSQDVKCQKDLENIMTEILELTNQTIYKLEQLG